MNDQILAANTAGEARRDEEGRPRKPNAIIDACCGLSVPTLVLFAITPWIWDNVQLIVGFAVYYLAIMPLANFLQNLFLLRFGYSRLDDDDDDGSDRNPSPEPPPFDGIWKQSPRGRRGRHNQIEPKKRDRGCYGQKSRERPLVSPGPR